MEQLPTIETEAENRIIEAEGKLVGKYPYAELLIRSLCDVLRKKQDLVLVPTSEELEIIKTYE